MPFQALVDGQTVVSLRIGPEEWRALRARVRAGEDVVRMTCCPAPGILKISPRKRQFFAHKSKPETCDSKPESLEHLDLKAVVHDAVLGMSGWAAEIEAAGPDWVADVLATRGRARIAFEVQLSPQGQAETSPRQHRYKGAGVLPWWIVTSRNGGPGFGSELRSVVKGENFAAKARETRKAVHDILRRVESQVRIAEAIARYLRHRKIVYQPYPFCRLPICFEIEVLRKGEAARQAIVVGELGADAVPEIETLRKRSPESPWGTVVQFVKLAPQIKGLGSLAFFLKRDPATEVPRILDQLLSGKLVWRGRGYRDEVEAALVWYREVCPTCRKPFARAPFAISGHLREWEGYPPKLISLHADGTNPRTKAAFQDVFRQFEERVRLRLGTVWYTAPGNPAAGASQICPNCGQLHTRSLISAEGALRSWPHREPDWLLAVPRTRGKWMKPVGPPARRLPSVRAWRQMIGERRRQRDKAEEEERQREQERAREMAEWREQIRRRREEEAAAAEAARVAAARRQQEEEKRQQAETAARREVERLARENEARTRLQSLAVARFGREDKAALWMHTYQPKIRGRPFEICVKNFKACADLLGPRR